MNRREYLSAAGIGITTAFAGCASGGDDVSTAQQQTASGTSSGPAEATFTADSLGAPERSEVGADTPVTVTLSNAGSSEGTYEGTVTAAGGGLETEASFEATLAGGETTTVEAATFVPDCETPLELELAGTELTASVTVTPYPTPQSEVHSYRYGIGNTGRSPDTGPSSQPSPGQAYDSATTQVMRFTGDEIAISTQSEVRVLEPDGSVRWTDSQGYGIGYPAVSGDRLYTVDSNDLLCYDLETGDRLWEFTDAGPPTDQVYYTAMYGVPLVADGTVYFNGMHGRLWALNAYSGCLQWQTWLTPDEEEYAIKGVPAMADGTLYVVGHDGGGDASDEGPLYVIDPEAGDIQWTTDDDTLVAETVPVRGGRAYVKTQARGFGETGSVRAYDLETGDMQWETELEDIESELVAGEERVYAGRSYPTSNASGGVVALDAADGSEAWRTETDSGVVSDPTVAANGVYAVDWDGNLYGLSRDSGEVNWRNDGVTRWWSSPTIRDDSFYIVVDETSTVTEFR